MTKRHYPIIFNGPMVRALLAGTKTQTRRLVKPQPDPDTVSGHFLGGCIGGNGAWSPACALFSRIERCAPPWSCLRPVKFPYGDVGDRLWVRETFRDARNAAAGRLLYRASGDTACKWTPGIHMPRAASRITLEVTGVRVEPLQAISIEDAKAEGAWPDVSIVSECEAYFRVETLAVNPRLAFRMLWERINGPQSWEANPWVWVVEFKRVSP